MWYSDSANLVVIAICPLECPGAFQVTQILPSEILSLILLCICAHKRRATLHVAGEHGIDAAADMF